MDKTFHNFYGFNAVCEGLLVENPEAIFPDSEQWDEYQLEDITRTWSAETRASVIKLLTERLYHTKPFSDLYYKGRRLIIVLLSYEAKYQEDIIVFKSLGNYSRPRGEELPYGLNAFIGIFEPPSEDLQIALEAVNATTDDQLPQHLFSEGATYLDDPGFEVRPRFEMEYNPEYKQLVANSYITDGQHIILLKTKDQTRIQNKLTLIQGHVSFDETIYLLSQRQYNRQAAIREFLEEVTAVDDKSVLLELATSFPETPRFYINTRNNHIDIEHFGIVYEVTVGNAVDLFTQLTTAESENHELGIIAIADWKDHEAELDGWALNVVQRLAESLQ